MSGHLLIVQLLANIKKNMKTLFKMKIQTYISSLVGFILICFY